jgi:hypothetical protein
VPMRAMPRVLPGRAPVMTAAAGRRLARFAAGATG